ncbi:MAG: DUF456 domain-containing protein [Phycisphaerales bacterium]
MPIGRTDAPVRSILSRIDNRRGIWHHGDMIYLWLTLLVLLNGLWLILVVFGLPGNWLMALMTALFAWWRWDEGLFSGWTLIAVAVLALIGEAIEFLAGMVGARKAGASWQASIVGLFGALVGAVMGTVVFPVPIVGTILGTCLGAGICVWAVETSRGEHPQRSMQRAVGAGVGKFLGIVGKLAVGVVIWLIIAIAAFWP